MGGWHPGNTRFVTTHKWAIGRRQSKHDAPAGGNKDACKGGGSSTMPKKLLKDIVLAIRIGGAHISCLAGCIMWDTNTATAHRTYWQTTNKFTVEGIQMAHIFTRATPHS